MQISGERKEGGPALTVHRTDKIFESYLQALLSRPDSVQQTGKKIYEASVRGRRHLLRPERDELELPIGKVLADSLSVRIMRSAIKGTMEMLVITRLADRIMEQKLTPLSTNGLKPNSIDEETHQMAREMVHNFKTPWRYDTKSGGRIFIRKEQDRDRFPDERTEFVSPEQWRDFVPKELEPILNMATELEQFWLDAFLATYVDPSFDEIIDELFTGSNPTHAGLATWATPLQERFVDNKRTNVHQTMGHYSVSETLIPAVYQAIAEEFSIAMHEQVLITLLARYGDDSEVAIPYLANPRPGRSPIDSTISNIRDVMKQSRRMAGLASTAHRTQAAHALELWDQAWTDTIAWVEDEKGVHAEVDRRIPRTSHHYLHVSGRHRGRARRQRRMGYRKTLRLARRRAGSAVPKCRNCLRPLVVYVTRDALPNSFSTRVALARPGGKKGNKLHGQRHRCHGRRSRSDS
jgi:hypothetical protein